MRTKVSSSPAVERMPVLFVGHGSPMNAIEDNRWSRGFTELGKLLPRPRAIVAISAHWYVDGTYAMANEKPATIHDFGGFPAELYEIEYPATGHAELSRQLVTLLDENKASLNRDWGLDHGTWSVLRWMYPEADVPVVQLSIDRRQNASRHWEIGRALAPLREQGILILSSGNMVHNLPDAFGRLRSGNRETPAWAQRFDADVARALVQRDARALQVMTDSDDGRLAHPSPDHWLPLFYAAGASDATDEVSFLSEGFDLGSISMRNAVFG